MDRTHQHPPKGLLLLCIVLLLLGIFFRFANLERKIYWGDEVHTSLRISGYTQAEMVQQVFDGPVIGIEDLQKYQRLSSDKSFIDTIHALVEHPEHPPLYYVMARFWMQLFGDYVRTPRGLSASISLLVFPCVYWLCLELFKSPRVGWVAVALFIISPFHVLYAQEAREYSLWTVTILLSSAALLWSRQRSTKLSWGVYAATVALGLYTHLLFILVTLAHGLYLLSIESFRLSKIFRAYMLALVGGGLAFVPWLWVLAANWSAPEKATGWIAHKRDLFSLVKSWVGDLSRVFLDLGNTEEQVLYLIPLIGILLILIGYSLYFLCRYTPQEVWLFIITLIVVTGITLILSDLTLGTQLSILGRYLIPCFVAIELAVAYLLATKVTLSLTTNWQRKLWQIIMVGLFSIGILSCAINVQAQEWWNKDPTYHYPQVASIINQSSRPLVISDTGPANIIALSNLLNSNVRFELLSKPTGLKIANSFSDVFLYRPSVKLQDSLEQQNKSKVETVYEPGKLFRLKKS
ncbi:MAG TPA: glycosyltransferase family 39 protein [Stenomitos sp.]